MTFLESFKQKTSTVAILHEFFIPLELAKRVAQNCQVDNFDYHVAFDEHSSFFCLCHVGCVVNIEWYIVLGGEQKQFRLKYYS